MSGSTRLLLWLYEQSLAPDERDAVIGDVLEEFERRSARHPRAARRWLWADASQSLVANVRRRVRRRQSLAVHPQTRSGVRMLAGFAIDVRFALRLFRRQPLSSLVAFVSLAAALGLNVLLVTLADAALVRALPVRDPSRLALLLLQRESGLMHNLSYPDYTDLRDASRTATGLVGPRRSRRSYWRPCVGSAGGRGRIGEFL